MSRSIEWAGARQHEIAESGRIRRVDLVLERTPTESTDPATVIETVARLAASGLLPDAWTPSLGAGDDA